MGGPARRHPPFALAAERNRCQAGWMSGDDERDGVPLTDLDQPLFGEADATKRDLVDYLDAVRGQILPVLADRPLSVIRALRGQAPFMQKNVPKYTPDWVQTVTVWAEASKREVPTHCATTAGRCCGSPTSAPSSTTPGWSGPGNRTDPTHLVLDIDPPSGGRRSAWWFARAHLVRQALADVGLAGAVRPAAPRACTCSLPLDDGVTGRRRGGGDARDQCPRRACSIPTLATTAFIRGRPWGKVLVDSTRAGGATVVAAYSPRLRPGTPVSFPVPWAELDAITPGDFTVHTAGLSPRWERSVGQPDAGTAAAQRRAGRRGAHHPRRPGPGHARGQAPGPRPPRLTQGPSPTPARPA